MPDRDFNPATGAPWTPAELADALARRDMERPADSPEEIAERIRLLTEERGQR